MEIVKTKVCKSCRAIKLTTEFHLQGRGERDSHCAECRRRREREEHRQTLSPERRAGLEQRDAESPEQRENRLQRSRAVSWRARREKKRSIMLAHKRRPCSDCGGIFHPDAMEFDHREGKVGEVSSLVMKCGTQKILDEIAKCDLVCANCHRVRTANRRAGLPPVLPGPEFII